MSKKLISIRISNECIEAYTFLKSKYLNPAKFLREGGEKLVIQMAERYKRPKLVKYKLPF